MTQNQIKYQQMLEERRANRTKEAETERSNRTREAETERSNRAQEDIGFANVAQKREQMQLEDANRRAETRRKYWLGNQGVIGATTSTLQSAAEIATKALPGLLQYRMSL